MYHSSLSMLCWDKTPITHTHTHPFPFYKTVSVRKCDLFFCRRRYTWQIRERFEIHVKLKMLSVLLLPTSYLIQLSEIRLTNRNPRSHAMNFWISTTHKKKSDKITASKVSLVLLQQLIFKPHFEELYYFSVLFLHVALS